MICPHCGKSITTMDKSTLKEWLGALNIPSVLDVTQLRIPDCFYVAFSNTLSSQQEIQVKTLGFNVIYDADGNLRSRYLIKWLEPRPDED